MNYHHGVLSTWNLVVFFFALMCEKTLKNATVSLWLVNQPPITYPPTNKAL